MPRGGEIIIDATRIMDSLLNREGGTFSDRPEDSGGPTKWGWTQSALSAVYRRDVSREEVQNLTRQEAHHLYLEERWQKTGIYLIASISMRIAVELLDTNVNLPPARAGEFLQRALNALNQGGSQYADIKVDGNLGPATRAALSAYLRRRGGEGETVLLELLNDQLGCYYLDRAEKRAANEFNFYGWILNRVVKEA